MRLALEQQAKDNSRPEEEVERARTDRRFFAEWFLGDHLTFPFGDHHLKWFSRLHKRGGLEAIAAPRGSAKTTFFSFLEPLHDICYKNEQFIIIISET